MKQPRIRITGTGGKDWGYKKVTALHWNVQGRLWMIEVDFITIDNEAFRDLSSIILMYDFDHNGTFTNDYGNLKGRLEYD